MGWELVSEVLLTAQELPSGFAYPPEFLRAVEAGLLELEPWWVLTGDMLRAQVAGMRERYPERRLVPFARRQDNDDVACWDLVSGKVAIVHDYASPGWESRGNFEDFTAWLHGAIDDLLDFR